MPATLKTSNFNPSDNSITLVYEDNVIVTQYFNSPTEAKEWLVEHGNAYGF